jgi:hypothetical protein
VASIIDANVLVELAQRDQLEALRALDEPRLVPDIVDDEMQNGKDKYADQHARYTAAVASGLLEIRVLVVGTPAYAEYLRLRRTRTSPGHNRGEDTCVALAITIPGSVVYTNETKLAKARSALGDPARVRGFR